MTPREIPAPLVERARQPGFTPGRRDIGALLDLIVELGADRDDDVRAVERALSRRAELALPAALERLGLPAGDATDDGRGDARLLRLVGRAAAGADPDARDGASRAVAAALADERARVRRQAALALARTGGAGAEDSLLAAWQGEAELTVRRALASALGRIGGARAVAALRAELPGAIDPELRRLLERAILTAGRTIDRGSPDRAASAIDGEARPPAPLPVLLRCRAGLERLLAAELSAGGWTVRAVAPGRVETVLAGPLASLFHLRLHTGFAFPLAPRTGPAARAVVDALASPEAGAVLSKFTRGAVRFRIEWERGGHRRGEVWRIAGEIAARRPDLVNDPTDSTWHVRVAEDGEGHGDGGRVQIALEPRKLDDPRFAYRVAEVPAASHPTVAAALARLSVVHSLAPAGDVVWDPFVGSGLELCERGRLAPSRRLAGSDVNPDALAAARANLDAAGVAAELVAADALGLDIEDVTVILTNPPMGRRVLRGHARPLLVRVVDRAAALLPPGGLLCWISPIPGETRARAAALGLRLEDAHPIDMAGFAAEIQVLRAEQKKGRARQHRRR